MMKEGGFEPIENKEEASEAGKSKKTSRFKKMAQVLGLTAGMAIGADKANALPEKNTEESVTEYLGSSASKAESPKDSERYWENILDSGYAKLLLVNFREYADYSFAQSLLERAAAVEPLDAIYSAYGYLSAPYGKKILRSAVQNVLSDKDRSKTFVAGAILNNIEQIEQLEDSEVFIKAAVERCDSFQILKFSRIIFEKLPRSVAESHFENATRQMKEEDPIQLLDFISEIVELFPGGKVFLEGVMDELAEAGSPVILDSWILSAIKEAFGKERVRSMLHTMLYLNPTEVLDKLESFTGNAEIYEALKDDSFPEARIMREIYESDFDSDTKKKITLILDQLVFDKHLSVEEAAELVKDDKKFRKLLEEIKERPKYIGSMSIADQERAEAQSDSDENPKGEF